MNVVTNVLNKLKKDSSDSYVNKNFYECFILSNDINILTKLEDKNVPTIICKRILLPYEGLCTIRPRIKEMYNLDVCGITSLDDNKIMMFSHEYNKLATNEINVSDKNVIYNYRRYLFVEALRQQNSLQKYVRQARNHAINNAKLRRIESLLSVIENMRLQVWDMPR